MKRNWVSILRWCYFVLPAILFAAAVFYFSSLEKVDIDFTFSLSDKLFHLLAYMAFGWLLLRAFHHGRPESIPRKMLGFAILVGWLYGLSDETHQYFVPGRSAEILDWIADAIGILMGTSLYRRMHQLELQVLRFASRWLS